MLVILGLLGVVAVFLVFFPTIRLSPSTGAEPVAEKAALDWSDFDAGAFLASTDGSLGLGPRPEPETSPSDAAPLEIDDYARDEDALVLVYDARGPRPDVTWDTAPDGVRLYADGMPIGLLRGQTSFDTAELRLIAE